MGMFSSEEILSPPGSGGDQVVAALDDAVDPRHFPRKFPALPVASSTVCTAESNGCSHMDCKRFTHLSTPQRLYFQAREAGPQRGGDAQA